MDKKLYPLVKINIPFTGTVLHIVTCIFMCFSEIFISNIVNYLKLIIKHREKCYFNGIEKLKFDTLYLLLFLIDKIIFDMKRFMPLDERMKYNGRRSFNLRKLLLIAAHSHNSRRSVAPSFVCILPNKQFSI